jgi:tetratricopeptide (TPR) repeat protein
LAALPAPAQPLALESPNFRILSSPKDRKLAEKILTSLEHTRAALVTLKNLDWTPARPVSIYLPASRREFSRIARETYEEGLYQSGPRVDWLTLNPESAFPTDIAAHEYLHAVLAHRLPDLPPWLNEGLCEYFATLAFESQANQWRIVAGRPPGNRLAVLRRSSPWTRPRLEEIYRDTDAYAWAWAFTHRLAHDPAFPQHPFTWPATFRNPLPTDEFPLRRYAASAPPTVTLQLLDPATAQDLNQDAAQLFSLSSADTSADELFLRGLRLFDDGDPAAARPLLEQATRLRPTQSSWWLTLASVYAELNDSTQEKSAAQKALATATNQTERQAAQAHLSRLP